MQYDNVGKVGKLRHDEAWSEMLVEYAWNGISQN